MWLTWLVNLTRYEATTQKDLQNIMREFKIIRSMLCQNDFKSTVTWVKIQMALGEDSCVLCYKQQDTKDPTGLLQDDDFVLIIMTKYQRDIQVKLTAHKVLVDSTHKTTGHDFQLTSLVTVDEHTTSRIDTNTMSFYFQHVQGKVGTMRSEVFMSDNHKAYYKDWTQKLVCRWAHYLCT